MKKLKGNFYLISLSGVPIQFVHGKSHTLPVLLLAIFLRKIPPVNQVSRTCNLRSAIKASTSAAGWFTCQLIAAGHLISPACWMDFSSRCLPDSCCSGQRIKSYDTCTFSEVFRLIHEISGSSSIKQKEKKLNISQRSFAEVEQEAYYTWQPKLKTCTCQWHACRLLSLLKTAPIPSASLGEHHAAPPLQLLAASLLSTALLLSDVSPSSFPGSPPHSFQLLSSSLWHSSHTLIFWYGWLEISLQNVSFFFFPSSFPAARKELFTKKIAFFLFFLMGNGFKTKHIVLDWD